MDERDAYWLWYDFNDIAGSAVRRQESVDGDAFGTDWQRQNQAMMMASLSFACALIEEIGRKNTCDHTRVLAHLRNALLHNGGDITKNRGAPKPESACRDYLKNSAWCAFDPDCGQGSAPSSSRPYFTITSTHQVVLSSTLYKFVERLLSSFRTPQQIAMGAPR